MEFVDSGEGNEGSYLYLKEINDNDAALLYHLGFEPLDCNNGVVVGEPELETWVRYQDTKPENEIELNLYCELLKLAYEIQKTQTNGFVSGSGAEEIRNKMFHAIKTANIL